MPRFTHKDTGHVIETSNARERVTLLASGYREQKAKTAAVRVADAKKTDSK